MLAHFSPDEFPKLMQHLAEAEWRALKDAPNASSVVEPLWKWFRDRFERSPFHDRTDQIHEWANIAYLQPERSLELAELAVSLTTAPASENDWLRSHEWNSHEHSLKWLPRMLAGVAEHHPDKVARCFDLLWQLGRDKPADANFEQGHPISIIGDVVTYKLWKSMAVYDASLDWFERLLAGDDWLRHLHSPGWLLSKFFDFMFATSIEENWTTGRTFHMRSLPLHISNTAPFRERILALCRKLLAQRNPHLAIQTIPVLEKGCGIARFHFGGEVPKDFADAWDVERMKCLKVLEEMSLGFGEPLIQFRIRCTLMRDLRYGRENPAFRDACRDVLTSIPDTLDLRIARTAFGNCYEEFECGGDEAG